MTQSTRLRYRFCWVALALSGGATATVGKLAAAEGPMKTYTHSPRPPHFHPLRGTAIGVLVGNARSVIAEEGRSGPPGALYFSTGGDSYRWVYVAVSEKPSIGTLTIPVGEKGATSQRFENLSLATPETVKWWKTSRPFTLVRVEVNGGKGSPPTDRFVATKLEVLEGTDGYTLRATDVVQGLKIRLQKMLDETHVRAAIDAGIRDAERQAAATQKPTSKRETHESTYVTWEPHLERLLVEFHTQITVGVLGSGRGTEPMRPGQPGAPPGRLPAGPGTYLEKALGVETAIVFEVDKTGKDVTHRFTPPQPIERVFPPPQFQYGAPPPSLPPR
jgi:hypothetical protein